MNLREKNVKINLKFQAHQVMKNYHLRISHDKSSDWSAREISSFINTGFHIRPSNIAIAYIIYTYIYYNLIFYF